MNDKFDELAKNMAQSVTRRGELKKFGLGIAGTALERMVAACGVVLLAVVFLNGMASKIGSVRFPTAAQDIRGMSAVRQGMAAEYGPDWMDQLRYMMRTNASRASEMINTFSN